MDAIGAISKIINQVNDISNTIATAVEEQDATTNEMTRNVTEAAKGANEIAKNIVGVAEAAKNTAQGAGDSQKSAHAALSNVGRTPGTCGAVQVLRGVTSEAARAFTKIEANARQQVKANSEKMNRAACRRFASSSSTIPPSSEKY